MWQEPKSLLEGQLRGERRAERCSASQDRCYGAREAYRFAAHLCAQVVRRNSCFKSLSLQLVSPGSVIGAVQA